MKIKSRFKLSDFFCANTHTQHGIECKSNVFNNMDNKEFEKIFFNSLYACPYFEDPQYVAHLTEEDEELQDNKNAFLKQLENDEQFPLLLIRGHAGSGKSTFLFKTMHDYCCAKRGGKQYKFENYELENPSFTARIGDSDEYGVKDSSTVTYGFRLFEYIVFCKAVDLVTNLLDNTIRESAQKRNNFEANFEMFTENNTNVTKLQREVVEWIGHFCNDVSVKDRADLREIVTAEMDSIRNKDIKRSVVHLLELTAMVIYCSFDLSKKSKDFCFLCFDGIEYFINTNKHSYCLYCEDVIEIMESINNFTRHITSNNSSFVKTGETFSERFKIIVTLRDTTERYLPLDLININNINDITVDVTRWYRFNDILDRKFSFFKDKFNYQEETIKLIGIIMKDTKALQKGNSLIEMLEGMYNYDKRNLTKSLFFVLDNIQTNFSEVSPKEFIEFWNKGGDYKYLRYLCRRAIIRLIFNKIRTIKIAKDSEYGLLDELFFRIKGRQHISTKYARKILLYLISKQYNGERVAENFISLKDLIKGVFGDGQLNEWEYAYQTNKSTEVTYDFARVLFFMSNYNLLNSFWQQLVVVKCDGSTFNKNFCVDENIDAGVKVIEELLINCYGSDDVSTNKNGIKITYTGVFLAWYQPEFSFFACRIEDNGRPLILSKNPTYICRTIQAVYIDCVKCIRAVIDKEHEAFNGLYAEMYKKIGALYVDYDKNTKQTHPYRIIESHINHLSEYRNFIHKENIFTQNSKDIIIACINEHLDCYNGLRQQLEDGHGGDKDIRLIENEYIHYNLAAEDGKPLLQDVNGKPYGYYPKKVT